MENREIYSIRYVARQTGLKPHTLRTWEKRYAAVSPRRTDTNRRLYSTKDLDRLQLLKNAVDAGHPISQAAAMNTDDLRTLVGASHSSLQDSGNGNRTQKADVDVQRIIDEALDHVIHLNQAALERTLENAAVSLPRQKVLNAVIQPMFQKIGEMWAAGKLKIVNEHMATIATRTVLMDMLKSEVPAEGAPMIVIAAPVGQWHESGALVAALTAAEAGWRPLYFGPNLPSEEIAAAVRMTGAKAVALSICHHMESGLLQRELRKLKKYVGDGIRIFVGGSLKGLVHLLKGTGAKCIISADGFRDELKGLQSSVAAGRKNSPGSPD